MADVYSRAKRSEIMRRIRSKHTTPERTVRKLLRKLALPFKTYSTSLPGHPDIVLPSRKKVIFVHGCFWHQHKNCSRSFIPKSRKTYWVPKLKGNVLRFKRTASALRRDGWKVSVIWECQARDSDRLSQRIKKAVAWVRT
ncbi:MAG: DNA mismatch endonuclease Vsr [Candidatus Omnitrophica bacterium]|nr:DNA mismatch endonuclease Vsr [Candidatus Omnitrophota bacterium]